MNRCCCFVAAVVGWCRLYYCCCRCCCCGCWLLLSLLLFLLLLLFFRVLLPLCPPNGKSAFTLFGSLVSIPCASTAAPGGREAPSRASSCTRPVAMTLVAQSITIGKPTASAEKKKSRHSVRFPCFLYSLVPYQYLLLGSPTSVDLFPRSGKLLEMAQPKKEYRNTIRQRNEANNQTMVTKKGDISSLPL